MGILRDQWLAMKLLARAPAREPNGLAQVTPPYVSYQWYSSYVRVRRTWRHCAWTMKWFGVCHRAQDTRHRDVDM